MLNHNLDFECARAIRDLELIPQITDSLSRLYKLNYEGKRFKRGSGIRPLQNTIIEFVLMIILADSEIISTSDILKWMEVLIKMDRLSEGNRP